MNGEIKYDGSDNVKLNDEVNVDAVESSQENTNTAANERIIFFIPIEICFFFISFSIL